jgi:hypothetical protein
MKILNDEIIKKEHLYEGHIYCINFEKNKLGLFKDDLFHILQKNNKIRSFTYEQAQVFGYCSKIKDCLELNSILSEENLSIYENTKKDLIDNRINYTGAFLSEKDHVLIIEMFRDKVPSEWRFLAHHMTINIGGCNEEYKHLLNTSNSIKCIAFGIDIELEVAAIKVESDIPSDNKQKHITFAVGANGKPYLSNKIDNWEALQKQPVFNVDIGVSLNNNKVIINSNKSKKLKL